VKKITIMPAPLRKILSETTLSRLPLTPPLLVDIGETVEDIIHKMNEASLGCVLILKDKKLAGIFTERDLVHRVIDENIDLQTPIGNIMNSPVTTLSPEKSIAQTICMMVEKGYRHIPLMNKEGEILGLVRSRDIINYFAEHFPYEVYNQPPDPTLIPQTPEGA